MAHFEVYILNYNGAAYLPRCLEALEAIDRGGHEVQVSVIDNGSHDDSAAVLRAFPRVHFIPLGVNCGFSLGNNKGVEARVAALRKEGREPDVHVFLNNDTAVDRGWLTGAWAAFRDPAVGIVGSKSLFMDRFALLNISTTPGFCPAAHGTSSDSRQLGVFLSLPLAGENIFPDIGRTKLQDAYGPEPAGRWLGKESTLFVAIKEPGCPASVRLRLQNPSPIEARVAIYIAADTVRDVILAPGGIQELSVELSPQQYRRLIQNAGSFVTTDWNAGDRGFLETDEGQYDHSCEVDAVCGVSMFIRHRLFAQLGGFDPLFFAYFEDTDLSLRARVAGYRCWYASESTLHHVHCGSGGEYSEYFNRNVAWSHLVFCSKYMRRSEWRARLNSYRHAALEQFQQFEDDKSLVGKPQLQAYCRYAKRYHRFLRNRAFFYRCRPGVLARGRRGTGSVAQ